MSAVRSWTVFCDGCDDWTPNPDLSHRTAAEARREARLQDYRNVGDKDFCSLCVGEGKAAAARRGDDFEYVNRP